MAPIRGRPSAMLGRVVVRAESCAASWMVHSWTLRADKRKVDTMNEDADENAQEDEPGPVTAVPPDRWRALPARVRVEDQSTSVPASDAPDPDGGRNPDNDWLLRGV